MKILFSQIINTFNFKNNLANIKNKKKTNKLFNK